MPISFLYMHDLDVNLQGCKVQERRAPPPRDLTRTWRRLLPRGLVAFWRLVVRLWPELRRNYPDLRLRRKLRIVNARTVKGTPRSRARSNSKDEEGTRRHAPWTITSTPCRWAARRRRSSILRASCPAGCPCAACATCRTSPSSGWGHRCQSPPWAWSCARSCRTEQASDISPAFFLLLLVAVARLRTLPGQ